MHKFDIASILSALVAAGALGTDAAFGTYLQTLFGTHANAVLAALGALGLVAATLLRVVSNPSPPAGSSNVTTTTTPPGA